MGSMDFGAFIDQGWTDHGDAPEAVAQRLEAVVGSLEAAQVAPFVRLALHLFASHLDATERGIALLRATGSDDASVSRGIATLRLVGGAGDALAGLSDADRIVALCTASVSWFDRAQRGRGIDAFEQALVLAAAGLPDGSPALRALAVGGNNLAAALEGVADRTAAETAAMVAAAETGLAYWQRAGGWLERQRAEYRLAMSLLQAGRADDAARAAQRCLAVCAANDAPAFERFFGQAALAAALRSAGCGAGFEAARAEAFALYEQVPADERTWCEADRAALAAGADAATETGP